MVVIRDCGSDYSVYITHLPRLHPCKDLLKHQMFRSLEQLQEISTQKAQPPDTGSCRYTALITSDWYHPLADS